MPELLSFSLDSGNTVLVEVNEHEPGVIRASRSGDLITAGVSSFETALAAVREAASGALDQFRDMTAHPDEIQIEFGVRLNAQAGAVIAKTSAEGHLAVKLTWKSSEIGPDEESNA